MPCDHVSDLYLVLSDLYVDLSLIHLLKNKSKKKRLCPFNVKHMTIKLSDKST